jgi:adenosylcobinamide-phosphate synthase
MIVAWILFHTWLLMPTLLLEAMVGYPAWLHTRIPHPVVWAGTAIGVLDRRWDDPQYSFATRRLLGSVAVLLVTGAAVVLGAAVEGGIAAAWYAAIGMGRAAAQEVASDNPYGLDAYTMDHSGLISLAALLAYSLAGSVGLAQRSLFVHVRNVLSALRAGDLKGARQRVSMIVGRDTQQLDASGVSAAALESLAESFNDGIVAPAFWLAIGGLPGLFAYKVLNTADSLIGHKEERWRAFGWAAARADDVANLVPARIAGMLLVFAGWAGLLVMFKDASKHASPNAGWPEAAMAGALGVRLGGATAYDGVVHDRPVFGTGPAPGTKDLARGLRVYIIACLLLWWVVACVALISLFFREP